VSMQRFEIDLNSKQISFLRQFLGGAWIPSWVGCRCHILPMKSEEISKTQSNGSCTSTNSSSPVFTHLPAFQFDLHFELKDYSFCRHDISSSSLVGIPENHERQTQFLTLIATGVGHWTTYTIITISALLTCPLPIISGAQGANCSFHPGSL